METDCVFHSSLSHHSIHSFPSSITSSSSPIKEGDGKRERSSPSLFSLSSLPLLPLFSPSSTTRHAFYRAEAAFLLSPSRYIFSFPTPSIWGYFLPRSLFILSRKRKLSPLFLIFTWAIKKYELLQIRNLRFSCHPLPKNGMIFEHRKRKETEIEGKNRRKKIEGKIEEQKLEATKKSKQQKNWNTKKEGWKKRREEME